MREAPREWKQRRKPQTGPETAELEHLRNAYRDGLASGPGQYVDMDSLLTGFKSRFSRNG